MKTLGLIIPVAVMLMLNGCGKSPEMIEKEASAKKELRIRQRSLAFALRNRATDSWEKGLSSDSFSSDFQWAMLKNGTNPVSFNVMIEDISIEQGGPVGLFHVDSTNQIPEIRLALSLSQRQMLDLSGASIFSQCFVAAKDLRPKKIEQSESGRVIVFDGECVDIEKQ